MITRSEENYLKTIFSVFMQTQNNVSTNEIANLLDTSPASVTEMIKKLQEKNLVIYEKYNGVRLSNEGETKAIAIINKINRILLFRFIIKYILSMSYKNE